MVVAVRGPQEKEFAWSRTLLKAVSVSPVNMCGVVAYRYAARKSLQDDRVLMGCPAEPLYATNSCMPLLCLTSKKTHGKTSQQAEMTTAVWQKCVYITSFSIFVNNG